MKAMALQWSITIHIIFHPSLPHKTILINVAADITGKANVYNIANFFDTTSECDNSFSSALISQILWHFYNVTEVLLNCQGTGNAQFQGSILVPKSGS